MVYTTAVSKYIENSKEKSERGGERERCFGMKAEGNLFEELLNMYIFCDVIQDFIREVFLEFLFAYFIPGILFLPFIFA
jgi:hypothetical protein